MNVLGELVRRTENEGAVWRVRTEVGVTVSQK